MKIHYGITIAMKVLGIETSCDETAVCLVEAEGDFGPNFAFTILGNALNSQAAIHAEFGGVFPKLAKREHAKNLVPLTEKVLRDAHALSPAISPTAGSAIVPLKEILAREPELLNAIIPFLLRFEKPDIDAIAVTHGPGLEPALWVGINFAKALSAVWGIPIVAVNHMEGHIVLSMIDLRGLSSEILQTFDFPVLSLLISGGHTELVLSKSFGNYELIGQTRDDAAGEAFDKVARLLDLPYPGGPEISRLASLSRNSEMSSHCVSLPRPMIHEKNYDFSFSGLKTAVRNLVASPRGDASGLEENFKMDVAREFEDAVTEVLVKKTMRAVEEFGVSTVVVGGGVSANTHIRQELAAACKHETTNCKLLIPPPDLATDNALMIALAGYFRALQKEFADIATLRAQGNLKLDKKASEK